MLNEKRKFCANFECLYTHKNNGNNTSQNIFQMHQSLLEIADVLKKYELLEPEDIELFSNRVEKIYSGNKNSMIITTFDRWLYIKNRGVSVSRYFNERNYSRIIIYGMGHIGKRLVDELQFSDIEVVCAIDKRGDSIGSNINILQLEDTSIDLYLKKAQVVVLTMMTDNPAIRDAVNQKCGLPVVSFSDILLELISGIQTNGLGCL